jgi:hypothetical protein
MFVSVLASIDDLRFGGITSFRSARFSRSGVAIVAA